VPSPRSGIGVLARRRECRCRSLESRDNIGAERAHMPARIDKTIMVFLCPKQHPHWHLLSGIYAGSKLQLKHSQYLRQRLYNRSEYAARILTQRYLPLAGSAYHDTSQVQVHNSNRERLHSKSSEHSQTTFHVLPESSPLLSLVFILITPLPNLIGSTASPPPDCAPPRTQLVGEKTSD
jgi:hypothetical protein